MAFRPLLVKDVSYDEYSFTNSLSAVATVRVAEQDNPPVILSLVASLAPRPSLGVGFYEFSFSIVELDVALDTEHIYWNGAETKSKLTDKKHRRGIVTVACEAVSTLVEMTSAPLVFMQTCDANLPLTVREKYERIIKAFLEVGYTVERQPPYHGRDSWVLERIAA